MVKGLNVFLLKTYFKIKQNVNDNINKDLKNLKKLKYSNNIIENMSNINSGQQLIQPYQFNLFL